MQSGINFNELLSADNTVRRRAEESVQSSFDANPSHLAQELLKGIAKEADQQVTFISCVLLKKYYLDPRATIQLPEGDLEAIKLAIQQSFDFENQTLQVLKRKADVLSKIFVKLGQNQQFFQSLAELMSNENPKCREFAMYGFEILSEISLSSEELLSSKNDFIQMFEKALVDSEVNVRIAALKAITAFISGIEDQDTVMAFASVLPTLLNLVEESLKHDEDKGRQAIDSMCELTSAHPEVWKNSSETLMRIVAQVASHKDFEDGTRAAAIELGLSLAEAMPSTLRKSPEVAQLLIKTLVDMLMEVETDEQIWSEQTEDTDKLNNDPVSTAISALARLTEQLGEKTTLTTCQPIIIDYVKQDVWAFRFAGYTLLGLITATCVESYSKNLQMALQTASAGVKDSDTRVRFAAFGALSSLMTELAPAVQKQFHGELVPVIAQHMVNEPHIKMQTQATNAMYALCSGLVHDDEDDEGDEKAVNGQEIMQKFAQETLQALQQLLEKGITQKYEPLQMVSLSLIGTIAEVVQEEFGPFFTVFITAFASIINSTENDTQMESKKLSAKAIETMGSIISAVAGSEDTSNYKPAVVEITMKLASIIQGKLADDDPRDEAIKETLTHCAEFLGNEFAQFMPLLLEQLISDAKLDLDFKMTSVDEAHNDDNMSMRVKVKGFGEQRVSMNTDALVRKMGAFTVLTHISERMGESFAPYAKPLIPIVIEHVAFDHNKKIRSFATKILKNIIVAVGEPDNVLLFQEVMPVYFKELEKSLGRKDSKTTKILIKSLANILRALGRTNTQNREFLTQTQINTLGPVIKGALELVGELKNAHKIIMAASKANLEIDEEDMDKIKEELAKIGRLGTQTMELTGQLVEIFKDAAAETVKANSLQFWAAQLQDYKNITEDEVLDALCYFCDVVDNTSVSQDHDMIVQLLQKYGEILKSDHGESDNIQHTIAYGLGEFGYFLPKDKFAPYLAQSCTLIKEITRRDGAFTEELLSSTQNAMGALAKLGYKHLDEINVTTDDLVGVLGQMPFMEDECEAQTSHRLLIEQIQDGNSIVNTNAAIKQAAQEAIRKIREHVATEKENADVKILNHQSKMALQSLNF